MPSDRWSELDRRARYSAYVAARTEADRRGHPMPDGRTVRAALDAYRCAVLPDHDARVRAEERARVAEQIAQAIEAGLDYGGPETADAAGEAVSIARAHAITEDPT